MSGNRTTWLVIPAYNEEPVLGDVLASLEPLPYGVVVVDDGSEDATADVATRCGAAVVRHACNLGQGAAIQTGITYARRQAGTRFVVTFDADGQHHPTDLRALLEPLEEGACDVVLGSRFLVPGSAVRIPVARRLVLRLATVVTRLSTGLRLTDTHNGLRAFTAQAAAQLDITQNGMAHASGLRPLQPLSHRAHRLPVATAGTPDHAAGSLFGARGKLEDAGMS